MKKIRLKSPAKINLTLEVIKKLQSGFHELRSVMLKLSNLYDELEIAFDYKGREVQIVCDNENVPTDKRNIVFKIAEKFFERTGKRTGLRIKIKKRIPVSAGLGGGSSNGASVLLALNDHFGKPLSSKGLIEVAAEVGKDIPVFLSKERLVYVSGMGEKMKPISKSFKPAILIAKPEGEISTPWAYEELDKKLLFMGDRRRLNLAESFLNNISNLGSGSLYNDFEVVANEKYPEVKLLKNSLLSFGAVYASLTGKGPTVFGIFKTKQEALKARMILKRYHPDLFIKLG